jgi:hypothetical protein
MKKRGKPLRRSRKENGKNPLEVPFFDGLHLTGGRIIDKIQL